MDLFAVEISQCVLEELPTLRDLQSAILSTQSLYQAYQASRKLVRQRVFYNETVVSASVPKVGEYLGRDVFILAHRRVKYLEQRDPYDGLILREALWPHLMASQQTQNESTDILCT